MTDERDETTGADDEHTRAPLDPEEAHRGLPKADPDAPVPQDEPVKDQGDKLEQ